MKNLLTALVTIAVAVGAVTTSHASIYLFGVWSWDHSEPVHIMVTPGPGGEALSNAAFLGGAPVDATIRVQIWAFGGISTEPPVAQIVPDYPFEDCWLEAPGLAG